MLYPIQYIVVVALLPLCTGLSLVSGIKEISSTYRHSDKFELRSRTLVWVKSEDQTLAKRLPGRHCKKIFNLFHVDGRLRVTYIDQGLVLLCGVY